MQSILKKFVLCSVLLLATSGIAQETPQRSNSKPAAAIGSKDNPVRCDDPDGEHWYLSRLRDLDGKRVGASRLGSTGAAADGHIMDMYQVKGKDITIFMDMYHSQYVETGAVPGFRLVHEFCNGFEYIDTKIHKFGESTPFTGEMIHEDDDGAVLVRAKVKAGFIDGVLTRFGENQRVVQTIPYVDGKRHGKSEFFFDSGQCWAEYPFKNGQLSGTLVVNYESGKVEHRESFVDGVADGVYETFYESGKPKARGSKKQGIWEGKYTEWDEEGSVTRELDLVDGRPRE